MVGTSPLVLLTGDAVIEDNVIIEQETPVEAPTVTLTRQSTPVAATRNRKQELTTVDQDHDNEFLAKDTSEEEAATPSTATGRPTRAAAKAVAAATASASEASEEEVAEETAEEKESSDESKGVKRTRSGRTVSRTAKEESSSSAAGGDGEQSPTRKSSRTTKK